MIQIWNEKGNNIVPISQEGSAKLRHLSLTWLASVINLIKKHAKICDNLRVCLR